MSQVLAENERNMTYTKKNGKFKFSPFQEHVCTDLKCFFYCNYICFSYKQSELLNKQRSENSKAVEAEMAFRFVYGIRAKIDPKKESLK